MSAPALPLTGPQQGMWAAQRLDPDSPSLWTAEAVELNGELDLPALEAAIAEAVRACDALHMRYALEQGRPVQRLQPRRASIVREDFSACADPWKQARAWMDQDLLQRPELGRRPLFATAVIALSPRRHLWYLRAHHIALDGFAYLLLIHRVAELYSARVEGRTPPPARDWSLQPAIAEEADYRESDQYARDREFWHHCLADAGEPPTLGRKCAPADRALCERVLLPGREFERWQAAARALGVDWAAWLIAAILAWMHARCGERELSLGVLAMNRLGSVALAVPCMAMNVVPLRLRVEPEQDFATLARRTAAALRALRPHQRYNYDWLRAGLGLQDSHAQLYGPVVNLMPFDRRFTFSGLDSRAHPISVGAVEDLDITVSPTPHGLRLDVQANPNAYDPTGLRAHHQALLALLDDVCVDAAERPLAETCARIAAVAEPTPSPRTPEAA